MKSPQQQIAAKEQVVCFRCRQSGHKMAQCPNVTLKPHVDKQPVGTCFKCGQLGHKRRNCPNNPPNQPPNDEDDDDDDDEEDDSDSDDDSSSDNPSPSVAGGTAPRGLVICHLCGQSGHIRPNCPQRQPVQGACFNCGQLGHHLRDCPKTSIKRNEVQPSFTSAQHNRESAPHLAPSGTPVVGGKMIMQTPYADHGVNLYATAQLQQMAVQRIQQNAGMSNFSGMPDSVPAEKEHRFVPLKPEEQRQWDGDAQRLSNPIQSQLYIEGQGGNATQSLYQRLAPDPNVDLERTNKKPRLQTHEHDTGNAYEDKPSTLAYESLEQLFLDEIIKLAKEKNDAEDAENLRHKENMVEINTQFLDKASALRALQAKRREEFLLKEAQPRLHHHHQAALNHHPGSIDPHQHHQATMNLHPTNPGPINPYQQHQAALNHHPTHPGPIDPNQNHQAELNHHPTNPGLIDPHGYSESTTAEAHFHYTTGQFESYGERAPFHGGGRNQATEGRVPIPHGRVYNNATSSSTHYY